MKMNKEKISTSSKSSSITTTPARAIKLAGRSSWLGRSCILIPNFRLTISLLLLLLLLLLPSPSRSIQHKIQRVKNHKVSFIINLFASLYFLYFFFSSSSSSSSLLYYFLSIYMINVLMYFVIFFFVADNVFQKISKCHVTLIKRAW